MSLGKKEKETFDALGFFYLSGFLNSTLLEELKKEIDRYIKDKVPFIDAADAFYDNPEKPETLKQLHRMEQDPFFAQYRQHPYWNNVASTMLGEPIAKVQGVELFNKPPNTHHETPPHQDNYYFCLEPPSVLTIWVALDPVDEKNGCIRYASGSHMQGLRPHHPSSALGFSQYIPDYSQKDRETEEKILADPGDALIHHGNTIHRAETNLSKNRHRKAFAMVFRGVSARRDETRFQSYQTSSNRQQASLGIEMRS